MERRRALVPVVRYPANLPITARRDDLLAAIRDHQVVVVAGETGSGKTTQLPKLCLELGRGVWGMIGHTQPRRLAARTVAARLCEELDVALGGPVAYAVRFTDTVRDDTLVKVMTDGILLAELPHDRLLRRYDTIIVDEAHERSLNIDFILGYLKQLLPRRPDLKVIVTSATIDTARVAQHFDGAPVIEVSGRSYPVEVRYRPVVDDATDHDRDQPQAVCDAVAELASEGPGDILVFLSGEREIRDTAEALASSLPVGTELLPLYARLSPADQQRAFRPHRGRRIVLATNVAETSLTVPGIHYVIDPGTARISRYSQRTKVQRLPIEQVSQSSADQRAGRCGRVAPGICIRLYSEDDYEARPEHTEPEILRTNLAAVLLRMAALRLGDVRAFPFLDAPDARQVNDGLALLEELGALDSHRHLTPVGRLLAELPIDVRLARMVVEADRNDCLHDILVIVSALSIQDPRERPADQRPAADEAHRRFAHPDSDLLAWLNLWRYVRQQQKVLSGNQWRKRCRAEFLNHQRIREWQDVCAQLQEATRELGMRPAPLAERSSADVMHRSMLAGLLSHAGARDDRSDRKPRVYLGARQARFAIWPASALARKAPKWVMAAELLETGRLWAREVAAIEPAWLEQLGAHLLRRNYGEPWWDGKRGGAFATEHATVYGLPIVDREIAYGRVDPEEARRMFIRHGLVEGDWDAHHEFLTANAALQEQVRALEDRVRRRDLMVDDDARERWYTERIPAQVTSGHSFDRWWKARRADAPRELHMALADVIDPDAGVVDLDTHPERWQQGALSLRLEYRFEPGAPDDGLSVVIPLAALGEVNPEGFDWHIAGWREELVTALIRGLPKDLRRAVGSVSSAAAEFVAKHGPSDGHLRTVLAVYLSQLAGLTVDPAVLRTARLPRHLRITFRVVNGRGETLASSTALPALQERLRPQVRALLVRASGLPERSGERTWAFGDLPRRVDVEVDGLTVCAYPGLIDEGESVGLRIFADRSEQISAMWAGSRRLLLLAAGPELRHLRRIVAAATREALARTGHGPEIRLLAECAACAADEVLGRAGGPVWDEAGYGALADLGRAELQPLTVEVANAAGAALSLAAEVRAAVGRLPAETAADLERQVDRLVYPGFVLATGYRRLPDVVRYIGAAAWRAAHAHTRLERDRQRQAVVNGLETDLAAAASRARDREAVAAGQEVRWMIEELRVSVFAQHVGTPAPVSEARIRRALAGLPAA